MRSKIGINDGQIIEASKFTNPSVTADTGYAEKTYRIGIEQTIELGNKRKKRIKLAKANKEITEAQVITALIDLRNDIRISYIEAYKTQEQLKLANEVLNTTTKLYEIANKREQAGDIAKLDVLQAEITMIKAKSDIQLYKSALGKSLNTLYSNLGQSLNEDVVLEKPFLYRDFFVNITQKNDNENEILIGNKNFNKDYNENLVDDLIQIAYKNRPELTELEKSIKAQDLSLKLAKANNIPNLNVSLGPDIVADNGTEVGVYAIASVQIPIFNRQQGAIKEIHAKKDVYQNELEMQKIKIIEEVKNAYASIVNTSQAIKIYEEELLPKALQVLEKSNLSFKEGKSNILMSLNAQEAYISTKFSYIQILTDYENALSKLERALGLNKEEDNL